MLYIDYIPHTHHVYIRILLKNGALEYFDKFGTPQFDGIEEFFILRNHMDNQLNKIRSEHWKDHNPELYDMLKEYIKES